MPHALSILTDYFSTCLYVQYDSHVRIPRACCFSFCFKTPWYSTRLRFILKLLIQLNPVNESCLLQWEPPKISCRIPAYYIYYNMEGNVNAFLKVLNCQGSYNNKKTRIFHIGMQNEYSENIQFSETS